MNMAEHDAKSPVDAFYRDSDDQALKVEAAAPGDVDKEHKEQITGTAGGKTKKFIVWRLTKRKWIGAIVGSVLLAIGLVLLILWFAVVVPLFQNNADKVAISLNHLDIVSVESGAGVRTLGVNLSLRLKHDLHIHATTDATKASLLYNGAVFAAVDLPKLNLKKGKQEYDLVIKGDAIVSSADVFEQMASALVTEKVITVDASAQLKAHAFGISKGGLKFDRTLELAALNNFKAPVTTINKMSVKSCSSSNIQISINATITNAALVGLDGVGALNLSLYYEQDYLGYAVSQLPKLGIPRGPSQQLFDLVMENSTTHLPTVIKMLKGVVFGNSQFWLTGKNEYSTSVELLRKPLEQLNMSISSKESLLTKVALNPQCDLVSLVLG